MNITLNDWLFQLCDTESPDTSIAAYHFGLFETAHGYEIYLIGSKEFDEEDSDWACNVDFEPVNKYFPLTQEEYRNVGWEKILERIISELSAFVRTEKFATSFFSKAEAVSTGFDDGDLVRIV
ncbi:hypothetical protein ACFOTA_22155 [Chitinophaga sp. GCM10012297]|uniref:Uncharacterized protein n=1 Tax=Chitinophaga chungangae TaxID=2821488 RepID=A0ABS3YJU1_9BACT|nr:hypothetical protein [Chitinophaga chungangae]MBO9154935.1 hypothetical protein [Chitinophaga chungangae]